MLYIVEMKAARFGAACFVLLTNYYSGDQIKDNDIGRP
jgi:hypothetical protein